MSYEVIHVYNDSIVTDGSQPKSKLIMINNELYGTTKEGGDNNSGTVFKIDSGGTHSVLHHF